MLFKLRPLPPGASCWIRCTCTTATLNELRAHHLITTVRRGREKLRLRQIENTRAMN
jgi:hypothetical protein